MRRFAQLVVLLETIFAVMFAPFSGSLGKCSSFDLKLGLLVLF